MGLEVNLEVRRRDENITIKIVSFLNKFIDILKPIYFVFSFRFFFVTLYPLSDGIDWRNQTPLREKSPFSHRTGTYTYIK